MFDDIWKQLFLTLSNNRKMQKNVEMHTKKQNSGCFRNSSCFWFFQLMPLIPMPIKHVRAAKPQRRARFFGNTHFALQKMKKTLNLQVELKSVELVKQCKSHSAFQIPFKIPFKILKELVNITLDKHAPLKKRCVRADQAPFMNKKLSKNIVKTPCPSAPVAILFFFRGLKLNSKISVGKCIKKLNLPGLVDISPGN